MDMACIYMISDACYSFGDSGPIQDPDIGPGPMPFKEAERIFFIRPGDERVNTQVNPYIRRVYLNYDYSTTGQVMLSAMPGQPRIFVAM